MVEQVDDETHVDCLFEQLEAIVEMAFMTISSEDREKVAEAVIALCKSLKMEDTGSLLMPLVEELAGEYFLKKSLRSPASDGS